jgi:hypothetical protein
MQMVDQLIAGHSSLITHHSSPITHHSFMSSPCSFACRVAQLYAVATLQQPRRFHPIRPDRERRRCTAPAQHIDVCLEVRLALGLVKAQ